jgi:hypothetical protein
MKSIKQFNISVFIRGFIIPIILFATIVGGVRLSQEITEIITFGFSSKLATLSLTAGAFVNLEDHEALIRPRSMSKIRPDNLKETYLVLSESGTIHQIHPDGSVSLLPYYPELDEEIRFTDFAVFNDTIYALNSKSEFQSWTTSGILIHSEILSLRVDATITNHSLNGNLAWGPDASGIIYVTDRNLNPFINIDVADITVLDFTFHPGGNLILLTSNQELIEINIDSGNWLDPISIVCKEPESCAVVHSIAYQEEDSIWGLSGALKLMNSSGMIDEDFFTHPGYNDHTSDRYLDYVIPMREISEKQKLTYFYSFMLNNEDRTISYVYDSNVNDDFTHIGYVDDALLLDDFIAASEILMTSKSYVSSIKAWGQWGLVKIGFAPIYSMDGRAGAIMGADQNVSSISEVSREALVILTLNSFIFLLFGATASWFIARSLTKPLLVMKDNVLSIAAGFLDRNVAEPNLKDLRPLASLFREAGDNLKKEVELGPQILDTFESVRREQDYLSYLSMKLHQNTSVYYECGVQEDDEQRISYCLQEKIAFGWLLSSDVDLSSKPITHNGVYQLCEGLSKGDFDLKSIFEHIDHLFGDVLAALILIDAGSNQIFIRRDDSMDVEIDKTLKEKPTKRLIESYIGNEVILTDKKSVLRFNFSTNHNS